MTASNRHEDDKTHVVYTTQQPGVRQVVDDREYAELKALGLIDREGRAKPDDEPPAVQGSIVKN